jgi:hypothetical protein
MQTSKRVLFAGVLATLALMGCATVNDVVAAKESGREGVAKEYKVSQDQAWDIAKAVFRWEGADAIEEHRKDGYMLTSSGMNLISAGAVMGAWVDKGSAADMTKVTVVTKRRMQTNFFTTLTETTFHNRFAQAVEIVKSGKPLPRSAPEQAAK